MKPLGRIAMLVALLSLTESPLAAQAASGARETIKVFFDCNSGGCRDFDYFRREVPYVNWVRNREDADVHVLVTSRATGDGGREITLAFIGRDGFEGQDQELVAHTSGDATSDEERVAVARKLKLGLVRYLAGTSVADRLRISYGVAAAGAAAAPGVPGAPGGPGGAGGAAAAPSEDPWDFWVFSLSANGFVNGESSTRFANYFTSLSANRTTELWKITVRGTYSRNVQEFTLPDRKVSQTREDWSTSGSLVRSLGAQWALGVRASAGSSTFRNQDFSWSLMPGVEYDLFPYAESSRRSLTLQYLVGPTYWDYKKETIFLQTSETRWQESLTARLGLIQPWGRWSTSLTGSHYFHDTSKYRVTLFGSLRVRLFKGFSVNISGNYSWIRDQLFLAAENASDDEILLRQRQLATKFSYFTSFGIQYRFGSIFNNVVNPRFGGGGQEFFVTF